MSSTTSPTRRVLGEKDANASLNLFSPGTSGKAQADPSSLLSPLGRINVTQAQVQRMAISPHAGQKRKISEVDGGDLDEERQRISASQQTDVLSDVVVEQQRPVGLSRSPSMVATNTSSTTPYSVVHQDQDLVDEQFELPADEMSQRTLDKIHEVSLPHNSSQVRSEGIEVNVSTGDSQTSSGMSSFIDFGGSEASQGGGHHRPTSVGAQQDDASGSQNLTTEERRKALLDQKAADLRTRLQFAYFKVQTNQTTTPFSRLKVPESMKISSLSPKSSPNVLLRQIQPPIIPAPKQHHFDAAEVTSLEDRISVMRSRATAQVKPIIRSLGSLPVPVIRSGSDAASSHQHHTDHGRPTATVPSIQPIDIPNSPPSSSKSAELIEDQERSSISKPSVEPLTPVSEQRSTEQINSPPPSHDGSMEDNQLIPQMYRTKSKEPNTIHTKDTPSSAIKGEVADSLLQLMRGVGAGKGMCGI